MLQYTSLRISFYCTFKRTIDFSGSKCQDHSCILEFETWIVIGRSRKDIDSNLNASENF